MIKILYQQEGYMTLTELADQLQVSVKTVRNDVAALREELSGRGEIETVDQVDVLMRESDQKMYRCKVRHHSTRRSRSTAPM